MSDTQSSSSKKNSHDGQVSLNRFRGWRFKLILVLAAMAFAMVCAEGMLRCVWRNPYATDGADRVVRLRMQHANTHHQIDRSVICADNPVASMQTNERSYILPLDQHAQPECTIAFLGGSTTECFAVDELQRFPALVSARFGDMGLAVNTLNAGTSGNTVHDSLNVLLNHVALDKPDVVVLMHACNDIGVLAADGDYRSRSGQFVSWYAPLRLSLMNLSTYSSLVGIVRQAAKMHSVIPAEPADLERRNVVAEQLEEVEHQFEQRLRVFTRMCDAFDAKPVLMTQPMSGKFNSLTPNWVNDSAQTRFNAIVCRVAKEEKAILVDLAEHLRENVPNWDEHQKIFYDGVHVTDEGSRVYGEHIVECLLPLVREISSASNESVRVPQLAEGVESGTLSR